MKKIHHARPVGPTTPAQTNMEDMTVLESVIERYLVKKLKEYDHKVKVKKISGPGWRGWPDRLALHVVGVTHWLEVKRPKNGKFEPLQLRCHRELRKLGFVVRVVNTKRLVDEYIEELRSIGAAMLIPEQPGVDLEYIRTPRGPASRRPNGM